MRRLRFLVLLLLGGSTACASMNPPPGGPTDSLPPRVVSITPDSGAVNVQVPRVVFEFDEVVNDRLEPAELQRLVLLSPMQGEPRVDWRRRSVEIRPRGGWRPNTTYSVSIVPGVPDLRGNRTKTTQTILFSTGPQLATQVITGRAFDWQADRVAPNALVEARPRNDTVLVHFAAADSVGVFTVGPLPGGEYFVRGYLDNNKNRQLDRGEPWDSTTVAVTAQRTSVDLFLALRDTLPPRIMTVTVTDSTHLAVEFDRAVDPSATVNASSFRLQRRDSTTVPIVAVASQRALDDERRRADSVAAAQRDTAAAARRDTIPRPAPPAPPGRAAPAPPPRPNRPIPQTTFVITVGEMLVPSATYRLSTGGVPGLTGRAGPSDRSFTVPAARLPESGDANRPPAPPAEPSTRRP